VSLVIATVWPRTRRLQVVQSAAVFYAYADCMRPALRQGVLSGHSVPECCTLHAAAQVQDEPGMCHSALSRACAEVCRVLHMYANRLRSVATTSAGS
jgi:hypothetical protein